MLAPNRIKHLYELQDMIGQEVYFVKNAHDQWSSAKTPFSDVRVRPYRAEVLISPRKLATPDDPIRYGAAEKGRTVYMMIDDPRNPLPIQATLIRVTDFNFNGRYNARSPWWSMFRTRDEAELHAVHASLSIPSRCPEDQVDIMTSMDVMSVFRNEIEPTLLGLTPFRT